MNRSFCRSFLSAFARLACVLAGLSAFTIAAWADGNGPKAEAQVGDAFARSSDDGLTWTIGTKSVQMTLDCREGAFRLVSFWNKSCEPPLEYVNAKMAAAPLRMDSDSVGRKSTGAKTAAAADSQWALKAVAARQAASGGRPVVQLDVTLTRGDILARFHVLAFPGTSILRQWVEIENTGSRPIGLKSPAAACFRLRRRGSHVLRPFLAGRRTRGGRSGEDVSRAGKVSLSPQSD